MYGAGQELYAKPDSGEGPFTKLIALGTVCLVFLTYLLVAASVHWWPFEAASCTFISGSETVCSSHNPQITVDFLMAVNGTGCTYDDQLQWGDDSAAQGITLPGGPVGKYFLASHTYTEPGTYSIQVTGTASGSSASSGGCNVFPATSSTISCTQARQPSTEVRHVGHTHMPGIMVDFEIASWAVAHR
jgi:hypothetical protein